MKRLARMFVGIGLATVALIAHSQEFPEGASTPTAAEIRKYVEDKVFNIKVANGNMWRLEYKSDGSLLFHNATTGARATGQWSYADGKLCDQPRGKAKSCNDVRLHQDVLYLKRENGEIIQYTQ